MNGGRVNNLECITHFQDSVCPSKKLSFIIKQLGCYCVLYSAAKAEVATAADDFFSRCKREYFPHIVNDYKCIFCCSFYYVSFFVTS